MSHSLAPVGGRFVPPALPVASSAAVGSRMFIARSIGLAIGSCAFWLAVSADLLPDVAGTVLVVALCALTCYQLLRRRASSAYGIMLYLGIMQPAIRDLAKGLPYLGLDYALIIFSTLTLWASRHVRGTLWSGIFGGIYLLFEAGGVVQSQALLYARTVAVPTFAFVACIWCAGKLRFSPDAARKLAAGFLIGSLGVGILIAQIYVQGRGVSWVAGYGSNFRASGGMGPNHVSLLFGIATFAWVAVAGYLPALLRPVCWIVAVGLAYMMILTFSRGGSYILALGMVTYTVLARRPSVRSVALAAVYAALSIGAFQAAISTTSGAALDRYSKTRTARVDLLAQGIRMVGENPLVGVGTGNYYVVVAEDEYFGATSGAHNELVRAAAEHGVPAGIIYVLMLFTIGARSLTGPGGRVDPIDPMRALRVTIFAMTLASLFYVGLKLAVQPMLLLVSMTLAGAAAPALRRPPRAVVTAR